MNRLFTQFRFGLEKKVVDLYAVWAVGATGAPTITKALSKGIATVVRNSAGRYTITLQDRYVDLLCVCPMIIFAAGSPAGITMVVRSKNAAAATPTVVVEFLDSTGAAVEVANGATVQLKLELKASSV